MGNSLNNSIPRLVKCAISLGVYAASNVRAVLARILGKTPRGSCVVLYYHSVPASQVQRFAKQLDQLLRHVKPITVNESITLQSGTHYGVVTFDDGFENFYQYALPEMAKRRIPSLMFVISDAIGKSFGPAGCSEKVMSLEQLRNLPEDSVTLGSHTMTHPFLPALNLEDAAREISLSRSKLQEILNRRITLFSFPFGGMNPQLVEICREAGYERVFSTLPYFAFQTSDEFVTGRVRVDPTDWPLEFRLKLAGAYRWLPWAFELKRKMATHGLTKRMRGARNQEAGTPSPQSMITESSN